MKEFVEDFLQEDFGKLENMKGNQTLQKVVTS